MATLYLLRHAESAPDPNTPDADWPLSKKGMIQAKELVGRLEPLGITQIISSPYSRAVETVRPFAVATDQSIGIVEDLHERKLCNPRWVGDNFLGTMQSLWSDLDLALQGGESGVECQRRVTAALQDHMTKSHEQIILVSSHGQAISLFLRSLDAGVNFQFWKNMTNPDLFRLHVIEGESDMFQWDKEFRPFDAPSINLM